MAPGQTVDINDLPLELRQEQGLAPVKSEAAVSPVATPWAGTTGAVSHAHWTDALAETVDALLLTAGTANADEEGVHEALMHAFERTLISRALQHTGGRRIEAAQLLGIGRNTITRKIQELKLDEDTPAKPAHTTAHPA
jgi:two-component system nitrogen regulation response regulator GlnG